MRRQARRAERRYTGDNLLCGRRGPRGVAGERRGAPAQRALMQRLARRAGGAGGGRRAPQVLPQQLVEVRRGGHAPGGRVGVQRRADGRHLRPARPAAGRPAGASVRGAPHAAPVRARPPAAPGPTRRMPPGLPARPQPGSARGPAGPHGCRAGPGGAAGRRRARWRAHAAAEPAGRARTCRSRTRSARWTPWTPAARRGSAAAAPPGAPRRTARAHTRALSQSRSPCVLGAPCQACAMHAGPAAAPGPWCHPPMTPSLR
jgi:hypothetical protein